VGRAAAAEEEEGVAERWRIAAEETKPVGGGDLGCVSALLPPLCLFPASRSWIDWVVSFSAFCLRGLGGKRIRPVRSSPNAFRSYKAGNAELSLLIRKSSLVCLFRYFSKHKIVKRTLYVCT
jgi:hypothetical protein